MKATKIFTLVFLFAALAANAQIVLTNSNVTTSATATEREQLVNSGGLSIPARGTNMQWNFSNMTALSGSASIQANAYMSPVNSAFYSATRAYVQTKSFAGYTVKNTNYFINNANGYEYVGYSVDGRTSFSLYAATKGLNDSLIVPAQDSVWATPRFILWYPTTYSASFANSASEYSHWSFTGNLSYHFILDLSSSLGSSYSNLQGTQNITSTITDSVIGWGTVQVPTEANSVWVASQAYSVLLIKEDTTNVIKYNVQNISALQLQTILGIPQGGLTYSSSSYIFYRAGTVNPLMFYDGDPTVGFDPDNTSAATAGIDNEKPIINFQQYPNPVTQSNLNFAFDKPDNNEWVMTITNETGQVVGSSIESQLAGPVQLEVKLPANLANGIYFYHMADGGSSVMSGKFILNR